MILHNGKHSHLHTLWSLQSSEDGENLICIVSGRDLVNIQVSDTHTMEHKGDIYIYIYEAQELCRFYTLLYVPQRKVKG